jgi:hypothetical protein
VWKNDVVLTHKEQIEMPDYQELYYQMVRASENAIQILVKAQQACEEAVMSDESDENIGPP